MPLSLHNKTFARGLQQLMVYEQAIIALCETLLRRGLDAEVAGELKSLRDDHRRHLSSLSLVHDGVYGAMRATTVAQLRAEPDTDTRLLLTRLAVLERRSHRLYAELLARELPVQVRGVLLGNLANEHVHAAWLLGGSRRAPRHESSHPPAGLEQA